MITQFWTLLNCFQSVDYYSLQELKMNWFSSLQTLQELVVIIGIISSLKFSELQRWWRNSEGIISHHIRLFFSGIVRFFNDIFMIRWTKRLGEISLVKCLEVVLLGVYSVTSTREVEIHWHWNCNLVVSGQSVKKILLCAQIFEALWIINFIVLKFHWNIWCLVLLWYLFSLNLLLFLRTSSSCRWLCKHGEWELALHRVHWKRSQFYGYSRRQDVIMWLCLYPRHTNLNFFSISSLNWSLKIISKNLHHHTP